MRILFVSHQASRTGAPLLLLWLVQWLRRHTQHELGVVLMAEGPLEADFKALCPTRTLRAEPLFQPFPQRLVGSLRRRRQDPGAFLAATIAEVQPDLVYLNTLVLGRYLGGLQSPAASGGGPRYLSHVHELPVTLNTQSNPAAVALQLGLSSAVISCAEAVQESLMAHNPIANQSRLAVVRGFIPHDSPDDLLRAAQPTAEVAVLHQRLQHARAEGRFVFGCTGQPISRKGFDLLPQLIQACQSAFGSEGFLAVWIGASEQAELTQFVQRDLEQLGLADQALIIPPVASALALIGQLHTFTLLSREDPFPLVVLEAASLGIPTVCFEGSGGIGAFVDNGCGLIVPYLDLQAMARSLHGLSRNPEHRRALGSSARERVFREHTLDQAATRILAIIEATVAGA